MIWKNISEISKNDNYSNVLFTADFGKGYVYYTGWISDGEIITGSHIIPYITHYCLIQAP